jgi:hypothetical protein
VSAAYTAYPYPATPRFDVMAEPRTSAELLRARRRGDRLTADQESVLYEREVAIRGGWCEDCGTWTVGPHGVTDCPAFRPIEARAKAAP